MERHSLTTSVVISFIFPKRSKTHKFQIYMKSKLFKRHLCTNSLQRTAVVLLTSVFAESLVDLQLWVSPLGEILEISGTCQSGPNKLSLCLYIRRFHVVSGKMDSLHTGHCPTMKGIKRNEMRLNHMTGSNVRLLFLHFLAFSLKTCERYTMAKFKPLTPGDL